MTLVGLGCDSGLELGCDSGGDSVVDLGCCFTLIICPPVGHLGYTVSDLQSAQVTVAIVPKMPLTSTHNNMIVRMFYWRVACNYCQLGILLLCHLFFLPFVSKV